MIKEFLQNESGLELSEYAVAAALIAIAAAGIFMALGGAITTRIDELSGHITAGK
jgi:pilus assembly protein Flp/PilA